MSCGQQLSIGQWHRSLFPQCVLLQHLKFPIMGYKPYVYMTPISGMLAVFASKNKEVVQNPNSSSRVEAVSTRVEFGKMVAIFSRSQCVHYKLQKYLLGRLEIVATGRNQLNGTCFEWTF